MPRATSGEGVLALDLGTSSVRAVVYDTGGAMLEKTLTDLPYKVRTTDAGEVSSDPDALIKLIAQSIDGALKAARKEKVAILGVGVSCYWHSLVGVDRAGRPTTELLTWADTRSAGEIRGMRSRFDERAYHARTGCFFHASYWPAKLRWLRATRAAAVRRTVRWISLGEYLYQQLHGETRVSYSIASGTGLLDVNRCQWDDAALRLAGITPEQLAPLNEWDQPARSLRSSYDSRWPQLRDAPWYLPLGDGGNVVRWFTDNLGLRPKKKFERAAGALAPDSHGLTVLPYWAGERSPNWHGEARAVIAGLSLGTQPAQLFRAAMEAITYQLVAVAAAMQHVVPRPDSVIATGGQLIHSPVWTQMLADALDVRVTTSPEREASSRGAALLVLHALGKLPKLWSSTPARGRSFRPRPAVHARYERARRRQQRLYELLLPSTAAVGSGSRTKDLRSPAAKR